MVDENPYSCDSQFSIEVISTSLKVRLKTTTAAIAQSEVSMLNPELTAKLAEVESPVLVESVIPFALQFIIKLSLVW